VDSVLGSASKIRLIKDALSRSAVAREPKRSLEPHHGWLFDYVLRFEDSEIFLFQARPRFANLRAVKIPKNSLEDILSYFQSSKLCPIRFSGLFCSTTLYKYYLATLSSYFRTYQGLSGATISPDILKCDRSFWDLLATVQMDVPPPLRHDMEPIRLIIPVETATKFLPKRERSATLQAVGRKRPWNTYPSRYRRLPERGQSRYKGKSRYDSRGSYNSSFLHGFLDKHSLKCSLGIIATLEVGQDLVTRAGPGFYGRSLRYFR